MSDPADDLPYQKSYRLPLYISDAELAKFVLGRDASEWPVVVVTLEKEGLPPKQPIMAGRRYLPACLEFFRRRDGLPDEHDGMGVRVGRTRRES